MEKPTKTIRTYIPVDVTMPIEHIEMVMSAEWQGSFYDFENETEFVLYAARLMLSNLLECSLKDFGSVDLTKFDGHCVDDHKGKFNIQIPDEGWSIDDIEGWVEMVNLL